MSISGERNRVFASSKFSHRTRETYSGSKAINASLSAEPSVLLTPLCFVGAGSELEFPVPRLFGAERHGNTFELFTPRDENGHLVTLPVLLEPVLETVRAHAEVVDREDLVVYVEAGDICRRVAL